MLSLIPPSRPWTRNFPVFYWKIIPLHLDQHVTWLQKISECVQVEVGVLIRKLLESPGSQVLLMDKIRLTTKDDEYPIIYRVLTIPGGCLEFLPSTVCGSSLLVGPFGVFHVLTWSYGGFLKCGVSPTIMGFPTRNDHLGVWNGGTTI